jgi:hypothetical protein
VPTIVVKTVWWRSTPGTAILVRASTPEQVLILPGQCDSAF